VVVNLFLGSLNLVWNLQGIERAGLKKEGNFGIRRESESGLKSTRGVLSKTQDKKGAKQPSFPSITHLLPGGKYIGRGDVLRVKLARTGEKVVL